MFYIDCIVFDISPTHNKYIILISRQSYIFVRIRLERPESTHTPLADSGPGNGAGSNSVCVCVCSAHRQVLPYSSRSRAHPLTAT